MLDEYPQTRTPEAEALIARLTPACDFDPASACNAWTRMKIMREAMHLRNADRAEVRLHLTIDGGGDPLLVVERPSGRTIVKQDEPWAHPRETPTQKRTLDTLRRWSEAVIRCGADPSSPPAWAYGWDALLMTAATHHGIDQESMLKDMDRPRFLCGSHWPSARRPRGRQPALRPIAGASGLSIGGIFEAGSLIVTDLMLSDRVSYRRRRTPSIVVTGERMPAAVMNGLPGMRIDEVMDHPYLTGTDMTVVRAAYSGRDTVLTVTDPGCRRLAGAPPGFPDRDSLRTCTNSGTIT